MNIHDRIQQKNVSLFVNIYRFEEGLRERLLGFSYLLERELSDALEAFADEGGRTSDFLRQVRGSIFSSFGKAENLIATEMRDLAEISQDGAVRAFNAGLGAPLLRNALTKSDLRALAQGVKIQGGLLEEWFASQSEATATNVLAEIRQGFALGESNAAIRDRLLGKRSDLKRTIRLPDGSTREVAVRIGGSLQGYSTRVADIIGKTTVHTISNQVLENVYRENLDVISAVQTVATLDRRTTPICISRDGASWNLETGKPMPGSPRNEPFPGFPPWHWRCRSILTPITRSWDEIADRNGGKVPRRIREAVPDNVRASMGGPFPGDLTYDEFLKAEGDEFAADILGDARFQLWKSGKITSHQLIDAKGRTLSIDELRNRVNLVEPVPR